MPSADIVRSSDIVRSARVVQLEGLFDVPPAKRSEKRWTVNLPITEREWRVGLIVGASGSGKSTVARELFGNHMVSGYDWPADRSIVDAFPASLGIKEITGLLSSVGFSSPPSWLRPFCVLSNGEQFRATMARAMAESADIFVVDEFTSVVDRTVARIGSHAIAKAVRSRNQRFIAVSCHYDIIDWLQPDWMYEPGTDSFQWRELQRRPPIELIVRRVDKDAWRIFRLHHYLSAELSGSAHCFCGFVEGRPAAFTAAINFPHPLRSGWREHRTVCLPDFQGCGIGNAMSEFVASVFRATGRPYFSTTSHPAMIRHRAKSPLWKMKRTPQINQPHGGKRADMRRMSGTAASQRLTAGFEYVGPTRREYALGFGLKVKDEIGAAVARVA